MSARYREEHRVNPGSEQVGSRQFLSDSDVQAVRTLLRILQNREASYLLDADQNNFRLTRGIVHRFDPGGATRTITGFRALDLDSNLRVIVNVGAGVQNVVLANESGSSTAENQILTHTAGNITLNTKESVLIFYDRTSARVRTVGFVP